MKGKQFPYWLGTGALWMGGMWWAIGVMQRTAIRLSLPGYAGCLTAPLYILGFVFGFLPFVYGVWIMLCECIPAVYDWWAESERENERKFISQL